MIDLIKRLLARRADPMSHRLQVGLLIFSAVGVVVLSVIAWQSSSLDTADLVWWPIVVSLIVAAPATLALKALEFDAAARIIGQRHSAKGSLTVAVWSSAANLLPLPGSLIVTVRSISVAGATYGSAMKASAVPGLAWLGITGMVGGIAIAVAGTPSLGAAVVVAGVVAGVIARRVFINTAPRSIRAALAVRVVVIESSWLALSGFRFWLALQALGVEPTLSQVMALSVAGALTVAIGFFPGGLGVREGLVAALAPAVGLGFGVGALAAVIDRLVWLVFLGPAALVLASRSARQSAR